MSTPQPYTWTAPDGAKISYTPAPTSAPAPSPAPAPSTGYKPSVPAAILSRLNPTPSFDDAFPHAEQWATSFDNAWFGGENFSGQPLDPNLITFPSGGGMSMGVSNGGKTGCLVHTNPADANKPGFDFAYGYAEADIEFPANNPAWPAFWLNGQSWPNNGENDVIEWLSTSGGGHIPTTNYHSGGPSQSGNDNAQNSGQIAGTWNGRHRFGCLRLPDQYGALSGSNTCNRYWDGQLVKQFATYDKGARQYMILSIGDHNSGGNGPMIVHRVTVWPLVS